MKFTEPSLEQAFITLLEQQGFLHQLGNNIHDRLTDEVLIEQDLQHFLLSRYGHSVSNASSLQQHITHNEIKTIIQKLKSIAASDLYESNKKFLKELSDGFILKRDDRSKKDILINLIDFENPNNNIYKFVTQLEILGSETRIPDGIIYINGIPLIVFEFKSTIREDATIYDAYTQLTVRYRRDIPELFKYNAFCVISDGVNSKSGSLFTPYEYFYSWRRVSGDVIEVDGGINIMYTMIQGMFDKSHLLDIIQNFIYLPDNSKNEEKIICHYPQYYAARALYENIKIHKKPHGDGKGGTYFGATGCGKSFTMLYLTRLLIKSDSLNNPTIVLITDRTDLSDQLSEKFVNAKSFIGDSAVENVESRADLRVKLQARPSGGVFLTTIQKFTEDTKLLTDRDNVICISDEAHRSQINLDQKVKITDQGVTKSFGFAKYLHDSLSNATYVGFTGTPIDATFAVFGKIVDSYTMTESVKDEITVSIARSGRAAKVILKNDELEKIERYYEEVADLGANEYQIEESKQKSAKIYAILGDPKRLQAIAEDFVNHYETRVAEGATVKGKAIFVSSNRAIAFALYKKIIALRPQWNEKLEVEAGIELTAKDRRELKPIERIKMVMTRHADDEKELWNLLGAKEYRKDLASQFKNPKSNFKIAIVVDMWLTGFDVPFLDTIYIDKFIQRHNLIQTISRVNRKFEGKNKGLVVDYIGIKKQMNLALAQYNKIDEENFEDIAQSLIVVKDHLDLLARLMLQFDNTKYFTGTALEQLHTLNLATEFMQQSKDLETRFIKLVKRLKAAYDICVGSEELSQPQRDYIYFYLAIRAILFKLTKGDAPDTAQMNIKVRDMIQNALQSDGVEEILRFGEDSEIEQDIFDKDYLAKIAKIKLPNTKIKLLQQLLAKAIESIKKTNKLRGTDFTKKMQAIVERYNDRDENDILRSEVYEEIAEALTNLIFEVHKEFSAGDELGIDFEEKAFYDILQDLCIKYDYTYPKDKMVELAQEIKKIVIAKAKYPDWNKQDNIKAELKSDVIIILDEFGYPPVERDEVYVEIFEQAENFKSNM